MKLKNKIYGILVMTMFAAGGCTASPKQMEPIGQRNAELAALNDVGPAMDSEVSFNVTELNNRNGIDYYNVSFTLDGEPYQYDIEALTGAVIDKKLPPSVDGVQEEALAAAAEEPSVETVLMTELVTEVVPESESEAIQGGSPQGVISVDQAKATAFSHAGVDESRVTAVQNKPDWESGRQVYEVKFYTDDYKEYKYKIDIYTGNIVSHDYDWGYDAPPSGGTNGSITSDKAKEIALGQVPGASARNIVKFEVDYDDGRLEYEGKIIYNNMEYEFEIDGYSGAIRSWDAEPAWD